MKDFKFLILGEPFWKKFWENSNKIWNLKMAEEQPLSVGELEDLINKEMGELNVITNILDQKKTKCIEGCNDLG